MIDVLWDPWLLAVVVALRVAVAVLRLAVLAAAAAARGLVARSLAAGGGRRGRWRPLRLRRFGYAARHPARRGRPERQAAPA